MTVALDTADAVAGEIGLGLDGRARAEFSGYSGSEPTASRSLQGRSVSPLGADDVEYVAHRNASGARSSR